MYSLRLPTFIDMEVYAWHVYDNLMPSFLSKCPRKPILQLIHFRQVENSQVNPRFQPMSVELNLGLNSLCPPNILRYILHVQVQSIPVLYQRLHSSLYIYIYIYLFFQVHSNLINMVLLVKIEFGNSTK